MLVARPLGITFLFGMECCPDLGKGQKITMDVDILLALWVRTQHELGTLMLTRNPAALLRHEELREIVKAVELSRSSKQTLPDSMGIELPGCQWFMSKSMQ